MSQGSVHFERHALASRNSGNSANGNENGSRATSTSESTKANNGRLSKRISNLNAMVDATDNKDIDALCEIAKRCHNVLGYITNAADLPAEILVRFFEKVTNLFGGFLKDTNDSQFSQQHKQVAIDMMMFSSMLISNFKEKHILGHSETLCSAAVEWLKDAFFSQRWLECAGSEIFGVQSNVFRSSVQSIMEIVINACNNATNDKEGNEEMHQAIQSAAKNAVRNLQEIGCLAVRTIRTTNVKELKSFYVLNFAWTHVVKILMAVPEQWRASLAEGVGLCQTIQRFLGWCKDALNSAVQQQNTKQLKVARFWVQHIQKLSLGYTMVGVELWEQLMGFTAQVHDSINEARTKQNEENKGNMEFENQVQEHIISKLTSLLNALLKTLPEERMKELLMRLCSGNGDVDLNGMGGASVCGRFMVAMGLLTNSQDIPAELRASYISMLFPWMIKTGSMEVYDAVIFDEALRSAAIHSGLVLVMTTALAAQNGHPHEIENWELCQKTLLELAVVPHPLLGFMLAQIWGLFIRISPMELQKQHIEAVMALTADAVAASVADPEALHIEEQCRQLSLILGHLLEECAPAIRHEVWNSLFDKGSVDDTCAVALIASVMDSYMGGLELSEATQAWLRTLTTRLEQVAWGAVQSVDSGRHKRILERHCYWLLRCTLACTRHEKRHKNDSGRDLSESIVPTLFLVLENGLSHNLKTIAIQTLAVLLDDANPKHMQTMQTKLAALADRNTDALEAVARICNSLAQVMPQRQDIFHKLLQRRHWLVDHYAIEALLKTSRQIAEPLDLQSFVPREIHDPSSHPNQPFIGKMKSYMQRTCPTHAHPQALAKGDSRFLLSRSEISGNGDVQRNVEAMVNEFNETLNIKEEKMDVDGQSNSACLDRALQMIGDGGQKVESIIEDLLGRSRESEEAMCKVESVCSDLDRVVSGLHAAQKRMKKALKGAGKCRQDNSDWFR